MDFDLRLTSGEDGDKGEVEPIAIDNILGAELKIHDADDEDDDGDDDAENSNMVAKVHDDLHGEKGRSMISYTDEMVEYRTDSNLEPLFGMEFSSHGEAYTFYQEYSRSVGFNTAIQNSRRSKTSREFIDAKFACSRYGTKREYDKKFPRPHSRQGSNKQDPENATGRRSCAKTNCKASMHVKRRSDGKWIIHNFVKEHNHELLPAQAICEKTRQIYAAMARQFAEYKNIFDLKCDPKSPFDRPCNLTLEASDTRSLLDFLTQMQIANPNFFYAVDLSDDLRMKNLFWVDAKSRHDYSNFSDVVSFDTTYVRAKYKIPLAVFVGVNHHYQFMLLGCAFISDEGEQTYSWLMRTWLKAVGGVTPKVIISDHCQVLKSVISEIIPKAYHCFCLWNIWGKITDLIKCNENFVSELERCIYGSWTADDFENRWQAILDRFELRDVEWIHRLYEDRRHWVPTFMRGIFLAGMSTAQRSESVNSFLDKYVHKRTTMQEFLRQYEIILQDRYEEEAKADFDTWNKHPALKSPSPLEKHVADLYTNSVFKKFQVEVLGAVACHPKQESQGDEMLLRFNVQDFEKNQHFLVSWNALKSEIFCICRLFEYKGFICRHAMIVLQMCGLGEIPFQYILNRWTKKAKSKRLLGEASEPTQTRVQRYNVLCERAMRLGEEGSQSQESFGIVVHALDEAFGNCVNLNNSRKSPVEVGTPVSVSIEDDIQSRSLSKMIKKKNPPKRKKLTSEAETAAVGVQDSFQQMVIELEFKQVPDGLYSNRQDKLGPRTVTLDSYYGGQQSVQGMVQLNLMAPTHDSYYGGQHTVQGLGQLNSIAPCHDGYYGAPQSMHGLGQMDFFRTSNGFAYNIRDEANARHPVPLHDDSSRHA